MDLAVSWISGGNDFNVKLTQGFYGPTLGSWSFSGAPSFGTNNVVQTLNATGINVSDNQMYVVTVSPGDRTTNGAFNNSTSFEPAAFDVLGTPTGLSGVNGSWSYTEAAPGQTPQTTSGNDAGQHNFRSAGQRSGNVDLNEGQRPSVLANAFVTDAAGNPVQHDSQGSVSFWAEVVGPDTPTGDIPLRATGLLRASASGAGNEASASWNVTQDGTTMGSDSIDLTATSLSTVSDVSHHTLPVAEYALNTPFLVTMSADAHAYTSLTSADCCDYGSSTAYADPQFFIDPSFAAIDPNYQSDYSILFSPGVNGAAPEPGVWALMLIGLGGVGGAVRGRSRAAA